MFLNFEENKIKKASYPDLICDQIVDAIKDGGMKPGDLLPPENDFAAQFGVSRSSVREALAGLEYLDVIVARNGRYYINEDVKSFYKKKMLYHYRINRKHQADVFQVRCLLERQFALLAAQRATTNDLKFMRQTLASIGERLEKSADSEGGAEKGQIYGAYLTEAFTNFHSSLAGATQNALLIRIFDRFKDIMFPEVESNEYTLELFGDLHRKAQGIVKGIENRDYVRTVSAMEAYLDTVKQAYNLADEEA